ncbi:hypothetical protein QBC35DRAFT_476652 [Podospora australis]|uniref:Uncharacterized protein n=1 Tax=Podospora australis TaxID=1536484 RepID=A0AAN6WN43_9PEZI|nr:hypothetical protein QBC35DRAFT_476652 [Podospora australis]
MFETTETPPTLTFTTGKSRVFLRPVRIILVEEYNFLNGIITARLVIIFVFFTGKATLVTRGLLRFSKHKYPSNFALMSWVTITITITVGALVERYKLMEIGGESEYRILFEEGAAWVVDNSVKVDADFGCQGTVMRGPAIWGQTASRMISQMPEFDYQSDDRSADDLTLATILDESIDQSEHPEDNAVESCEISKGSATLVESFLGPARLLSGLDIFPVVVICNLFPLMLSVRGMKERSLELGSGNLLLTRKASRRESRAAWTAIPNNLGTPSPVLGEHSR